MKKNYNYCIHCQGTGVNALSERSLSGKKAHEINGSDAKKGLVLTGVGARQISNEYTPGTFRVDSKTGSISKSYLRSAGSYAYTGYTGIGFFRGVGEEDNIARALVNVARVFSSLLQDSDNHFTINLSGFSRGATTAVRLVNELFYLYGNRIRVNLFLMDPVAGPGRHYSARRTTITPNVDNVFATFSRDDDSMFVRTKGLGIYCFLSDKTRYTAICLPGTHVEQDLKPDENITDEHAPIAAKINQYLLGKFMESSAQHFDHKKVEPAKIDDPRILIANNVLNDDKPHSLHSILDDFLADKNCYSQHDFFRWRKVSELTDLQIAINAIHSSAFRQAACLLLRTLIDELEKIDFSSIHEKYPKLTSLASKATEVINEVTKDSPNYFNILKVQSAFRDIAGLDEVSQECREVAAFFSSVVISLVSFAVGSVCGFLAGLARWKLGFIGGALVGALLTAINFAEKGKDMTYRNIAGNQVAQQFVTTSINTPLIS